MAKLPPILPPENTAPEPDDPTKLGYDQTGPNVPGRVFYMNFGVFKYGTTDKSHGAAILLSILLLIMIAFVIVFGYYYNAAWFERVFTWLGSAFLFVAGVAVGRSSGADKTDNNA